MVFCILSRTSIENNRKAVINVGIALQLTNILRDVHEDAMADRYFIPKQLLLKYDMTNCQIKRNFVPKKTSNGLFQPKTLRGR